MDIAAASQPATLGYAVSADLPTGRRVVPVTTATGVVMVVREGKITPEVVKEIVEMYDALTALGLIVQEE
ncbi:hypothetical protein [Streptomyces sp. PpalLS-921]|uniref:hypothetical protein n=1 Tax=Streptomyces sp. PpalLS-921 TaxID=1839772 RepID=UPI00114CA767|nr:hypothetical protein [Streptomyces sp. PpalLS-921]